MPTPEQELILNGLKKTVLPLLSKKNDGQHIINGKYIFTQGTLFNQNPPWANTAYGALVVNNLDILHVIAAVANNVGRTASAIGIKKTIIALPTNPGIIATTIGTTYISGQTIRKEILDTPTVMNQLGCSIRQIPVNDKIFQYILEKGGSVILYGDKIPPFYTNGHYIFLRSYDKKTGTYLIGQSFLQDYTLRDFTIPYTFTELFKEIKAVGGERIRVDGVAFAWGVVDGAFSNPGGVAAITSGATTPAATGRTAADFSWFGKDLSQGSYQVRWGSNTKSGIEARASIGGTNVAKNSLERQREQFIKDKVFGEDSDDFYLAPLQPTGNNYQYIGFDTLEGFHIYKNQFDTEDPAARYIHLLNGLGYVKFTTDANNNTILVDAAPLYVVYGQTKEGYTIYFNKKDISANPYYIKTASTPALAYYKYNVDNSGKTILPVDPAISAVNLEIFADIVA